VNNRGGQRRNPGAWRGYWRIDGRVLWTGRTVERGGLRTGDSDRPRSVVCTLWIASVEKAVRLMRQGLRDVILVT